MSWHSFLLRTLATTYNEAAMRSFYFGALTAFALASSACSLIFETAGGQSEGEGTCLPRIAEANTAGSGFRLCPGLRAGGEAEGLTSEDGDIRFEFDGPVEFSGKGLFIGLEGRATAVGTDALSQCRVNRSITVELIIASSNNQHVGSGSPRRVIELIDTDSEMFLIGLSSTEQYQIRSSGSGQSFVALNAVDPREFQYIGLTGSSGSMSWLTLSSAAEAEGLPPTIAIGNFYGLEDWGPLDDLTVSLGATGFSMLERYWSGEMVYAAVWCAKTTTDVLTDRAQTAMSALAEPSSGLP